MSAIFGLAYWDGRPIPKHALQTLQNRLRHWGNDGGSIHEESGFACGQALWITTPEGRFEQMPMTHPELGITVTATARLDNRAELCRNLGIDESTQQTLSDSAILFHAYCRWKNDTPARLYGDWSFAAWDARQRRLFLARDQLGNTGLFYYHTPFLIIFASHAQALLPLVGIPRQLDERKLFSFCTQTFIELDLTYWQGVRTLLPGYQLEFQENHAKTVAYWQLDRLPLWHFKREEECLEGFMELFSRAVQSRLRRVGLVGSTLSSGLDSSTVTALAARELAKHGQPLYTFTSIPEWEIKPGRKTLVDEWPLAKMVAEKYTNIIPTQLRCGNTSPIAGMKHFLDFMGAPHPASNLFWIYEMLESASQRGIKVLLTGQRGNGGISWSGGSNRIFYLFVHGHWDRCLGELREWCQAQGVSMPHAMTTFLLRPLARWGRNSLKKLRTESSPLMAPWMAHMARRPSINIPTIMHPTQERFLTLFRNCRSSGPLWQGFGSQYGMEIRDPTADIKLLEYCLGIPDELQVKDGGRRMVIRRATVGVLPDAVRLNEIRGNQAADLALRLYHTPLEVKHLLETFKSHTMAAHYLDLSRLGKLWQNIQADPHSPMALGQSFWLLNGLMAGMFVISLDRK